MSIQAQLRPQVKGSSILLPPDEKPTGVTHGKAKEQSCLTHQMAHGIPTGQASQKSKDATGLLERNARVLLTVGEGKVRGGDEAKGQLDKAKDERIHDIYGQGGDEEECIEHRPYW
jgi:hypothetical protein